MNPLARKFYAVGEDFQEVIFLNEQHDLQWQEIVEKSPDLPRGWFELSRLDAGDSVELVRGFWLDSLPFFPSSHALIADFFDRLDSISVVIVRGEEGLQPEMVYSLADGSSFFRGLPPATKKDIREFCTEMDRSMPADYLAFLEIHNGFGKLSELGVLKVEDIGEARRYVQDLLWKCEEPLKSGGKIVDPSSLIPFYETLGMGSFQCFYADWYPTNEMGNVYLSGIDYKISNVADRKTWGENLAFPTFAEWLAYYLGGMDLSF